MFELCPVRDRTVVSSEKTYLTSLAAALSPIGPHTSLHRGQTWGKQYGNQTKTILTKQEFLDIKVN